MFHLGGMRFDDPTGNQGRGWRRLAADEVADLAYMAIRLCTKAVRADLAGRNAAKADQAARTLAIAVSDRLRAYRTYGPKRHAPSHSTVGREQAGPKDWRG